MKLKEIDEIVWQIIENCTVIYEDKVLNHDHTRKLSKVVKDSIEGFTRRCKYKGCSYYSPKAKDYCCNACYCDAYEIQKD